MDTLFRRYRNLSILAGVLFVQVVMLGYQVKVQYEREPVRLARVWVLTLFTPLEKAVVHTEQRVSNGWHDYVWLRGVRKENDSLRDENERLRLEQIRLAQDAAQARRLQALLQFKEQTVSETVAAQVIGSSGSETSRTVYIDKGSKDGVRADMAVITSEGVVGKVLKSFPGTAQVLLLTDPSSGVGAILSNSRLQGILKGTQPGELLLTYVMSDEKVAPGEQVLTSGGDRIFPKGLPLGTVTQVSPGQELFLNIHVKPAAQISKLEEVLVITKIVEKEPEAGAVASGPIRAADILAQRLPTVVAQPPSDDAGANRKADPPSFTEWLRQQKAAQAAAAKQQAGGPAHALSPAEGAAGKHGGPASPPATGLSPKTGTGAATVPSAPVPKKTPSAGATGNDVNATSTSATGLTATSPASAPKKSAPKQQPQTTAPPKPADQPPATPPGVTL